MGSQQKKKKGTDDTRIIVSDIKRSLDQDTIRTALQPSVEIGRDPIIRTMIDFCNVLEGIDSNQTNAPVAPGQTVGLVVTPISGSQLNLAWTASTSPILGYYNVYKGISTGFVADGSSLISQPTTNSYSSTGLISGTQYFYRVSATNIYNQTGTISAEANGTTTGSPPPVLPTLWLPLNSTLTDASGNGSVSTYVSSEGYFTPGKFGSAAANINAVTIPPDNANAVYIKTTNNTNIQLDMTDGFSISLWIYPTTLPTGAQIQVIYHKADTGVLPVRFCSIELSTSGLIFTVYKDYDGVSGIYKSVKSGVVSGSWQHVAATFNPSTNTPTIYLSAVGSSTGSSLSWGQNGADLDLYVGRHSHPTAGNTWFKGRVDEVQYFKSRILTPTQVTNLMNTNAP